MPYTWIASNCNPTAIDEASLGHPLPPVSTLMTSEYWSNSTPDVPSQEISRRLAGPGTTKEETVDTLSHERLEVNNLWNRSLPINRLPSELLVHIFANFHSEFNSDPELLATWRREPKPGVAKLMGTCRHWRDIIIGTPALWRIVNLESNTNWTELCLARSVAAPVEVWARIPSPCHPERLKAAYPLVHRIRSLYFGVRVATRLDHANRTLTLPHPFGSGMPVLEDLNFAITDSLEQQMCPSLPIDVDLTVRRFPRLRRLALAGMVTPLEDTALYTQLRTLSLTTCSPPLSFDHFLDTLALCTQLEELCLKDTLGRLWGDFVRGDPAPCRPLISLPRLDRIVLSRHGALCTSRFLAHLHIQSSVRLDISADVNSGSPLCPCSITAMLPAVTLEPLATVNDIQLSMSTSSGPGAQSVWIRTDRTPDMVSTASLTVVLAAWGPHCGPHAALSGWGSVSDLPKVLGCSPATSLSVVNVQPDAVAAWAGVFRSCPLLERLSIQGIFWSSTCAVGIENAFLGLHPASMGADPGSPQAIACPRLAHVAVDGLETTAVYEAIRTCVRYRRDQGVARLQEIDLFLFRDPYVPSALDRACLDDILGCTERLRLRGSMDLVLSGRGGGG